MMTRKRQIVELEDLRNRLREAEETLAAIRNGEVDSLIVTGPHGDQVFSLKGAEQPYRVFVEQMLEGAVTLTSSGTILYCNRRFAEMLGSRLEKVIGSDIKAFFAPSDHDELVAILAAPAGRKARFTLKSANGALLVTQLAFSKLPVEEDIDAICVVVTDLTEQEEKRELAVALQDLRLAQEQLQKQNEELTHARAASEAANVAKDNFLAALSHELRTPLTPVLMAVTALQSNTDVDAAVREELAMVRRNVELEARLIDDLLDITRIARGKIDFKPGLVDVHALVASSVDICRNDIQSKQLTLELQLDAAESYVDGDGVRIQQILWNLLRNSVKFTPEGGRITVRSSAGDGQLRIDVIDTGIGIDPESIHKLFTPFEQTNRFITQHFGGLGLGLTISRRLAELHGGTITCHSDGRDLGATFTLTLPAAPAPKGNARSCDGTTAASGPHRRLNILLVEDHHDTRHTMARLLGERHTVRAVGTLAAALRFAETEPFDLVISDLGLPDGSGLDLMRQLKSRQGVKGICLSGFGMEDDVAQSAEAGFSRHLTKPIDVRALEDAIDDLADRA